MPFQIVHNDITLMNTEAIVNAANTHLQQGGGVCGAIFQAAGEGALQKECNKIGTCPVGQAVITKGYQLPAKYVIHAVGPIWNGGNLGEDKLLASTYRSSLELAKKYKLKSIAFPLISSGIYGYPKEDALSIAVTEISEFLLDNEMEIYLVVYDRKAIALSEKLFTEINHYINTYYDDNHEFKVNRSVASNQSRFVLSEHTEKIFQQEDKLDEEVFDDGASFSYAIPTSINKDYVRSINDLVNSVEETFSEMLLRVIDKKGKTDVEVYKRANLDRKLFSKIRNSKEYQPKKSTALALAISLELSLDETKDLLMKAGYSISRSNKFDLIIEYFIKTEKYDMYKINETLFFYEQPLLGA